MNRKILAGMAIACALCIYLCSEGVGIARRKGISSTGRVVIDGRSFVTDESSGSEAALLEKELARMGVRLPEGFPLPEATNPSNPVFSGKLKESTPPSGSGTPGLPAGLTAEHTLRMEGEGTPVSLVFGKIDVPGPSVRSRLLSSGWKSVSSGMDPAGIRILQLDRGKEITIVCLDESESAFLLFREVDR